MKSLEIIKDPSFYLFLASGVLGMVIHWAKKWLREQTHHGLYDYLFVIQKKYTATSVLTYFAAMAALLAVGNLDHSNVQALAISFMAGYMIDSAVNTDVVDGKL